MKAILLFIFSLAPLQLLAQPATEIYLFEMNGNSLDGKNLAVVAEDLSFYVEISSKLITPPT
ncbi:hypothetical protein D770_07005 [Flammeovirgaceae bacterium 311]|nr:hypothetical protein D770_07005 [Flammeovirgaceae bacterium 311]